MLAFVLGGGGSRGALQVGALQSLLEAGIKPDMVIGTSVGAMNGAFVAADPTLAGIEKLRAVWLQMGAERIFPGTKGMALLRFIRGRESLYPNYIMSRLLAEHFSHTYFSELHLPCYAVATDLDSGEIIAFGDNENDRLDDGLMSSTALIPAYPPWTVGERRFVDGGFGAVIPVRQAVERGATQIIALRLKASHPSPDKVQSAFEIMMQTSDLMSRQQTKTDLAYAAQHAQLTMIDLHTDGSIPIDDFSYTVERIAQGREVAEAVLKNRMEVVSQRIPEHV